MKSLLSIGEQRWLYLPHPVQLDENTGNDFKFKELTPTFCNGCNHAHYLQSVDLWRCEQLNVDLSTYNGSVRPVKDRRCRKIG